MSASIPLVVHVITRLDVGGAQATAIRICGGLDRSRFRPLLLTGPDVGSGGDLRGLAAELDVEVREVAGLRSAIRPIADVRAVRQLASTLRALEPAIVHTHSSKAGALGRVAARRAGGAAVVHTVHGWSFNDSQRPPVAGAYRLIERRLAKITDRLVVVTTEDRVTGLAFGIGTPGQYSLVRSGIDVVAPGTRPRAEVRRALGWGDDEHVVISVGRLEEQKDPVLLVRAVGDVATRRPVRLAVVGGGSLEAEVLQAAEASGMAGRLDLLGTRHDVDDLLAAADSFALASRFEGLPRAVLEAVRAGLPVVATDVGGVGEVVVDGETGRLVPSGDRAALAAAIASVVDDREGAVARAASAAERLPAFSHDRMVRDQTAVYDELIDRSPPGEE